MSRIRTIKPEYFADEKVGRLSLRARLLFIGLWCFADDMGTTRGAPAFLRAEAFPYDDVPLSEIASAIAELEAQNLIRSFRHEDQAYLSIKNFQRHQRITRPGGAKYPDPPLDLWSSTTTHAKDVKSCASEPDLENFSAQDLPFPSQSLPNPNPSPRERVVLVGME